MNKRVYLPLVRGGAFILLLVMIIMSFCGCGLFSEKDNGGKDDNSNDGEKAQPTEVVFKGYYSDADGVRIKLTDYDLTGKTQKINLLIENTSENDYCYLRAKVDVMKKEGNEWVYCQDTLLEYVDIFPDESSAPYFWGEDLKAKAEVEFPLFQYYSGEYMNVNLEPGEYKITLHRFVSKTPDETDSVSYTVGVLLELK